MKSFGFEVDELLNTILTELQLVLGTQLVGVYLYGSLVAGDFDLDISDIDLLVVKRNLVDEGELRDLGEMHERIALKHPNWRGRIEVAYVSTHALKTFRYHRSTIAVISPGEPLHFKQAGADWLINWYVVRSQGVRLFGAFAKEVIGPISHEEFVQAVKRQASAWRHYVVDCHSRPYQGYAVLTLCRALHTARTGHQVSKKKAAEWAIGEMPEAADQIRDALRWREDHRLPVDDPERTLPATIAFVRRVADMIDAID